MKALSNDELQRTRDGNAAASPLNSVFDGTDDGGAGAATVTEVIMTFETQSAAKRFVVAKVIEQAEREGTSLSAAERHMLSWSESDPELVPDPTLAAAQEREIPEAQFETKVAELIRRAYDRDCASNREVRGVYRAARSKLKEATTTSWS